MILQTACFYDTKYLIEASLPNSYLPNHWTTVRLPWLLTQSFVATHTLAAGTQVQLSTSCCCGHALLDARNEGNGVWQALFSSKQTLKKALDATLSLRACLPPIFSCVGSWFSKLVDADPDDCFGDFESMIAPLRLRRLACILDWPYATSLCTSGEPAPMQFPRPKMFNVDLSLALPLTASDLRGVALRASRSVALPSVCHGFLEPSRARQGEEVELDCVSWQGPNRVARPAVPLLRPVWSGSLRMPLHDCGMNCSL